MEFTPLSDDVKIEYWYTDIFVISALRLNLLGRHSKSYEALLKNLEKGRSTEKVRVPKSLFVKVKGVRELLSLMGFTVFDKYDWRGQISEYLDARRRSLPISSASNTSINESETKIAQFLGSLIR